MTTEVMIMMYEKKVEGFCRDCILTFKTKYPRFHSFDAVSPVVGLVRLRSPTDGVGRAKGRSPRNVVRADLERREYI